MNPRPPKPIVPRLACALVCLGFALATPRAWAYPSYDDGAGNGCVQCHTGFLNGTGPLHTQHRVNFDVATCNLCHPSEGGSTPVRTYWSGPGGGYGCAGCHGQDYGETSPTSGQAKASAYGLRQVHVDAGELTCGTGFCHQPGLLGHGSPFPGRFTEPVSPPYYDLLYSNLSNPCDSSQEDLPFDLDDVGLDNDGDGSTDYPDDLDCPPPPTPTPTAPFACGATPRVDCVAAAGAIVLVNEKRAGREKLKLVLQKLGEAVVSSDFGNPVSGSTAYKICLYDGGDALAAEYTVDRPGAACGASPCFSAVPIRGYRYVDRNAEADGISKMILLGGDAGNGKVIAVGTNGTSAMPTGVAAALQGETSAAAQVLASDGSCFGSGLGRVKTADGLIFKASGP